MTASESTPQLARMALTAPLKPDGPETTTQHVARLQRQRRGHARHHCTMSTSESATAAEGEHACGRREGAVRGGGGLEWAGK